MRRQIKKAWNRLETDGHKVEMKIARTEFEIMEVLPKIEKIHVERDHDTGRDSDLDDPKVNELWKRLVLAHGASGQIEISTMLIDGEIAGFVIGIIDDDAYRVFDGHFNSEFHRYSPGRIIEVGRAGACGRRCPIRGPRLDGRRRRREDPHVEPQRGPHAARCVVEGDQQACTEADPGPRTERCRPEGDGRGERPIRDHAVEERPNQEEGDQRPAGERVNRR